MHENKLEAVRAFCRKNKLDKIVWDGGEAKIGIVTLGKSYLDTRLALDELGIKQKEAKN